MPPADSLLYNPAAFRVADEAVLFDRIDQAPFALLATVGADGPLASHAPVLLDRTALTLRGHLARANPQVSLTRGDAGLAVFMGPDAYVSPGWYPSKQEHGKVVPTWNYTALHVRGRLRWIDGRDDLLALVTALTDRHEAGRPRPWSVTDAPADYIDGMLRAIIGFELVIDSIEGKDKLSQNRPTADRAGVAAAHAAGDAAAKTLARLMK